MARQRFQIVGATAGILAVALFLITFAFHSLRAEDFHPLNDYLSKLGSLDQNGSASWNISGFVVVGALFAIFGFSFGKFVEDPFSGTCMVCCGVGFAVAAIPAEMIDEESTLTKAHIVSVCIALASWCFGLARTGSQSRIDSRIRNSANLAGILTVVPMAGLGLELFPAAIGHRILLLIVFGWTIFICTELITKPNKGRLENEDA